jgi:hypothetical protein
MAAYLATGERRLPGTFGVPSAGAGAGHAAGLSVTTRTVDAGVHSPAVPAAAVSGTSNSPSLTTPSSTSVPSGGSSRSAADQLFANFTLVLNEMRNGNPPALSSVAALWQSIDALALQRLDALLSMEAGAMGVTKDTLSRDLFLASLSASNGV